MNDRRILLGRIVGVFGVEGWVKLHSYTEPRENIFRYSPWHVRQGDSETTMDKPRGRAQGKGLVGRLPGISDRDQAAALVGAEIWVERAALPRPEPGEHYWADLEGLRVVTEDGIELGQVSHLFSTGANDVLYVTGERERLIPYIPEQVVKSVDREAGVIRVDWDPEF